EDRWSVILSYLDYAVSPQLRDLAVAFLQHAQHLVRVLAEHRGRGAVFHRRAGKAHRTCHHRQHAGDGVLELDAYAARLDLRLGEYLRDVVDRAVRHARRFEELDPLGGFSLLEDVLQQTRDLGAVLDTLAVGGEAR